MFSRQLPPEPAPPRSVVIERLPPLPPKPRDIIIERWLPYQILDPKRKVVVQRAQKSNTEHPTPKNIIITFVFISDFLLLINRFIFFNLDTNLSKQKLFEIFKNKLLRVKIHKLI